MCVSMCGGVLDCSLPPWTGFSGERGAHRGPIATWPPSLCWNCMQVVQLAQHLRVLGIQTPDPRACVASSSTTESPPHKNNWRENNSKQNQPGVRAALTWWSHRLRLTWQETGHSGLAPWVPGMHIHGGKHKIIHTLHTKLK